MLQVNILEAKTEFSKLVRLLESRKEDFITVARNGKPVVKMTLISDSPVSNRIGIGKGKLTLTMQRSLICLREAAYESTA